MYDHLLRDPYIIFYAALFRIPRDMPLSFASSTVDQFTRLKACSCISSVLNKSLVNSVELPPPETLAAGCCASCAAYCYYSTYYCCYYYSPTSYNSMLLA